MSTRTCFGLVAGLVLATAFVGAASAGAAETFRYESNPLRGTQKVHVVPDVPIGGTGARMAFSIISGTLPEGLELDPDTGAITGVPRDFGDATLVIQGEDGVGPALSTTLLIQVIPD